MKPNTKSRLVESLELLALAVLVTLFAVLLLQRQAHAEVYTSNALTQEAKQPSVGATVHVEFSFKVVGIKEVNANGSMGKEMMGWVLDQEGNKLALATIPLEACQPVELDFSRSAVDTSA